MAVEVFVDSLPPYPGGPSQPILPWPELENYLLATYDPSNPDQMPIYKERYGQDLGPNGGVIRVNYRIVAKPDLRRATFPRIPVNRDDATLEEEYPGFADKPEWVKCFIRALDAGVDPDQIKRCPREHLKPHPELTLGGHFLYPELAEAFWRDEPVFWALNEAIKNGDPVILYLDLTHDEYRGGENPYHYAYIGAVEQIDQEGIELDDDESVPQEENPRYMLNHIIPLPLFFKILGMIEFELNFQDLREIIIDEDGTPEYDAAPNFLEAMDFLKRTFPKIQLALRSDWDPVYHPDVKKQKYLTRAEREALIHKMVSGPTLPESPDDEKNVSDVQEWLLKHRDLTKAFGEVPDYYFIEMLKILSGGYAVDRE